MFFFTLMQSVFRNSSQQRGALRGRRPGEQTSALSSPGVPRPTGCRMRLSRYPDFLRARAALHYEQYPGVSFRLDAILHASGQHVGAGKQCAPRAVRSKSISRSAPSASRMTLPRWLSPKTAHARCVRSSVMPEPTEGGCTPDCRYRCEFFGVQFLISRLSTMVFWMTCAFGQFVQSAQGSAAVVKRSNVLQHARFTHRERSRSQCSAAAGRRASWRSPLQYMPSPPPRARAPLGYVRAPDSAVGQGHIGHTLASSLAPPRSAGGQVAHVLAGARFRNASGHPGTESTRIGRRQ